MLLSAEERAADYRAKGWWTDQTIDHLVQKNRQELATEVALVDPANREVLDGKSPRRLTWQDLGTEIDKTASALLSLGLQKGDVVTYQTPNFVETVILALACARIGLVISPVVTAYRHHELSYVLDKVKPKVVVTFAHFAKHNHAEMMLKLKEGRDLQVLILGGNAPAGTIDFDELIARSDPALAEHYAANVPTTADDLFTIFWTSGTESRPKGVPREHRLWTVNGRIVSEAAEIRKGDVLLNPFPLVNIGSFGMVMPWLLHGGRLVLHHPFDLKVYLQQIDDEKVNYTIAAPAILNNVLKSPALVEGIDLSSLRAIGSGSAPLSPWMIEGYAERYGIEICNMYGSNEGATLFSGPAHVPNHTDRARYFPRMGVEGIGWTGETAGMIQTRLVNPETEEEITEPGIAGEMRFQGASTFSGYYDSPELTERAFDDHGYYKTGDLFEIVGDDDEARFYRFVGRCKDIIVRGGVNISPAELDDLLTAHPALQEAAVVGLPDDVLGERVCAAVVPMGDEVPDLPSLNAWLKEQGLAVFKLPERMEVVKSLPRNAMNKVVRRELFDQVLGQISAK